MKGRILLSLFATPFFAVGVFMLWSVSSNLVEASNMRDWHAVDATLLSAGYDVSRGDDSDTYKAYAEYRYDWYGQAYSGDRVAISSMSDNIGDYQQDTGSRLAAALQNGTPITVWVNPDNPADSIIDRSLRWGLIAFKSVFLFLFGGVGLVLYIAAWRSPAPVDAALPQFQGSPWLANPDWQDASIRSSSKATMWGAWLFAALWNLVSAPLPFVIYDEVLTKDNWLALVGLLFPIIGIGLLTWAIRRTLEWRRFGKTPLLLDPFPGSIGGHVGGTLDLGVPHDHLAQYVATLSSVLSYTSGSGENRSKREKILWQTDTSAHSASNGMGTRLTFRFDVPEELNESDADQSGDSYHLWRLNICNRNGVSTFDRDFNIPVYATNSRSRGIADRLVTDATRTHKQDTLAGVQQRLPINSNGLQKTLHIPMGRNVVSNSAAILIGGTFAAAGAFLFVHEGAKWFGSIFGGTGAIVAIAATYLLGRSLTVSSDNLTVRSTRRWLGIPLKSSAIEKRDFYRFEKNSNMQSQSGSKTTVYYTVSAIDRHANEIRLAEGLQGESEANAAIEWLGSEFGLSADEALVNDF